jgi:hypothetical protein
MPIDNLTAQSGSFVPTSYIWDVARLYEIDVRSDEFKELLVRLYQNLNLMAIVLNGKDTGIYNTYELVNGQTFFPNPLLNSSTEVNPTFRQVYRLVINFGALPNAATKSVPHGITITPATTFTRIYATASDTTGNTFIPIPYASLTLVNVVEINVDATNVNISTGIDRTNYNVCYVILEYLQQ